MFPAYFLLCTLNSLKSLFKFKFVFFKKNKILDFTKKRNFFKNTYLVEITEKFVTTLRNKKRKKNIKIKNKKKLKNLRFFMNYTPLSIYSVSNPFVYTQKQPNPPAESLYLKKTNFLIQKILRFLNFSKSAPTLLSLNYTNMFSPAKAWKLAKFFLKKHKILKKTRLALIFIQAAYALLKYKDPHPLSNCIRAVFEKSHFSTHRFYFLLVKNIIKKFCKKQKRKFKLLGVKLKLSGKLGVGGNAKKRKKYFAFGVRTNSTKIVRREEIISYVRTQTGVFGFNFSIFY